MAHHNTVFVQLLRFLPSNAASPHFEFATSRIHPRPAASERRSSNGRDPIPGQLGRRGAGSPCRTSNASAKSRCSPSTTRDRTVRSPAAPSRTAGDRQRRQQHGPAGPGAACDRRHPAEAQVLDGPGKPALIPDATRSTESRDPRRDTLLRCPPDTTVQHFGSGTHRPADRQLVPSVTRAPTNRRARRPACHPRGGRSPLAPRIRHIDVPTQPNHVFERPAPSSTRSHSLQSANPIRHNGDFHPGRRTSRNRRSCRRSRPRRFHRSRAGGASYS